MVKVPCHRTRSAQLALTECHTNFSNGTVNVVSQALNNQRHLMRGETFVGHARVLHRFSTDTGTFVDGTLDGVGRHRGFFGLLIDQAQMRIHVRVSTVTGCYCQLLGQLAENLAAAVCGFRFVFNLPLCAHYSSLNRVCRGGLAVEWMQVYTAESRQSTKKFQFRLQAP